MVVVFTILVLLSRMLFLSTGIEWLQKQEVPYRKQVWVQVVPPIFQICTVIYINKFKLHLLYFVQKELAPFWVRLGIELVACLYVPLILGLALIDCDVALSDTEVRRINLTLQITMLGVLSILSMVIVFMIVAKFQPNNEMLRAARLKLRLLEVVVQLMLITRMLVTAFQYYFIPDPPSTVYMVSYFTVFLLLSEILPLSIVVYSIYDRIDWKFIGTGSFIENN